MNGSQSQTSHVFGLTLSLAAHIGLGALALYGDQFFAVQEEEPIEIASVELFTAEEFAELATSPTAPDTPPPPEPEAQEPAVEEPAPAVIEDIASEPEPAPEEAPASDAPYATAPPSPSALESDPQFVDVSPETQIREALPEFRISRPAELTAQATADDTNSINRTSDSESPPPPDTPQPRPQIANAPSAPQAPSRDARPKPNEQAEQPLNCLALRRQLEQRAQSENVEKLRQEASARIDCAFADDLFEEAQPEPAPQIAAATPPQRASVRPKLRPKRPSRQPVAAVRRPQPQAPAQRPASETPPQTPPPAPNRGETLASPYVGPPLSFSQKGAIGAGVGDHWRRPDVTGFADPSILTVELQVTFNPDGTVLNVKTLKPTRFSAQPFIAQRQRAAWNSAQTAIRRFDYRNTFPMDRYGAWKELILEFDPTKGVAANTQ